MIIRLISVRRRCLTDKAPASRSPGGSRKRARPGRVRARPHVSRFFHGGKQQPEERAKFNFEVMRMSFHFYGGVHPDDKKSLTNQAAVTALPPPEQLVVPMSLHIGAPCQPTVAVGDTVKMGQKIGDSGAPVSAPIHAPVSGKVIAIEPRLHANGTMVNSVVIENDGLDTPLRDHRPPLRRGAQRPRGPGEDHPGGGHCGHGRRHIPNRFQDYQRQGQGGHRHHQRRRVRALHNL